MKEKLVLQSLADLGTGTAIRIVHYIEETRGHELSADEVIISLLWLTDKGYVAKAVEGRRQLYRLTLEGKQVLNDSGWSL